MELNCEKEKLKGRGSYWLRFYKTASKQFNFIKDYN